MVYSAVSPLLIGNPILLPFPPLLPESSFPLMRMSLVMASALAPILASCSDSEGRTGLAFFVLPLVLFTTGELLLLDGVADAADGACSCGAGWPLFLAAVVFEDDDDAALT